MDQTATNKTCLLDFAMFSRILSILLLLTSSTVTVVQWIEIANCWQWCAALHQSRISNYRCYRYYKVYFVWALKLSRGTNAASWPNSKCSLWFKLIGYIHVFLYFKTINLFNSRTSSSLHRYFYSFYSAIVHNLAAIYDINQCFGQEMVLLLHAK